MSFSPQLNASPTAAGPSPAIGAVEPPAPRQRGRRERDGGMHRRVLLRTVHGYGHSGAGGVQGPQGAVEEGGAQQEEEAVAEAEEEKEERLQQQQRGAVGSKQAHWA